MKKGINKYLGAIMMGTALIAVPSCTDTWNEHYQTEDSYTADKSLWELLENRADMSKFCNIVGKAKFYRDENHPAYTLNGSDTVYYTFKDVLNANTSITVWAPTNDAMSEAEWQKFETMAAKEGYNLQQQLLGNHIALFRKSMSKTGTEKLRLINNKIAVLDYDKKMFGTSEVIASNSDIGAKNGLLHVISTRNEFFYNLYEYVKFSGEVTSFRDYLVARDTTEFDENKSIEGLPDENGNPTYVDSVYIQDNMMFRDLSREETPYAYNPTGSDADDAWMNPLKMLNAQINTEDSLFVMVVPTDLAWATATENMKPYYNYGEGVYPRMSKVKNTSSKAATSDIKGALKSYNNGRGYETVDSLQAVNIEMDIIAPLAFNINLQPGKGATGWTKAGFMDGGYKNCEYFLTTTGDTIRDVYEEINGVKTLVWDKNSLFENGTLKEMSNGYAVVSDTWNYPRAHWMRDIDVEADFLTVYDKGTSTSNSVYDSYGWTDSIGGRCSENRYMNVTGRTPSSNPEISFILKGCKQGDADVMSAKYDVQVVFVPLWYNTSDDVTPDTTSVEEKIAKARLVFTLWGWSVDKIGGKDLSYKKQEKIDSKTIEYRSEKVDTITIMENVEFPLSYKNLADAYPVLHITSDRLDPAELKEGYNRAFNIDRIILKCKEAN